MAFADMGYKRSKADLGMHFGWVNECLRLWVTWIDNCLVVTNKQVLPKMHEEMTNRFDCDVVGNMDEYVGCKMK